MSLYASICVICVISSYPQNDPHGPRNKWLNLNDLMHSISLEQPWIFCSKNSWPHLEVIGEVKVYFIGEHFGIEYLSCKL